MKTALTMGRPEFVEILLDQGINMAEFLTLDNLKAIYSAVSSEICYFLFFCLLTSFDCYYYFQHTLAFVWLALEFCLV